MTHRRRSHHDFKGKQGCQSLAVCPAYKLYVRRWRTMLRYKFKPGLAHKLAANRRRRRHECRVVAAAAGTTTKMKTNKAYKIVKNQNKIYVIQHLPLLVLRFFFTYFTKGEYDLGAAASVTYASLTTHHRSIHGDGAANLGVVVASASECGW